MTSIEIKNWAQSANGIPIALWHSPHVFDAKNTHPIVLIGGVHGDEPEGVELAQKSLEWLQQAPQTQVASPWILIPCLNPDGYLNKQRTNGNGVDLNRNFPAKNWSASFEKERYHPGARPASEPEIQALVKLIEDVRPRLLIHFHSWIPCIVCTGAPGLWAAQCLAESSGYPLKETIGYDTPGSLSQYGWHDSLIPVICVEEQEFSDLSTVWPHFASGIQRLFAHGGKK